MHHTQLPRDSTPKRLLVISYDFPPAGGVSVQRVTKLVKYLPENGIEPIVLTNAHGLSAPRPTDFTLAEADYIKNARILRRGGESLVPYHRYKITRSSRLYPYVLYLGIKHIWYMDIFKAWFDSCRPKIEGILRDCDIDCILTTSPPHSVHFFGEHINANYDIPWFMDLRDAMVDQVDRVPSIASNLQERIHRRFEKRFVDTATHIIAVSEPIRDNIIERNGSHLSPKLSVLPNGFDPDDYASNSDSEHQSPREKLVITYTGSFTGQRTPRFFVDAFESLVRKNLIDGTQCVLRFVGSYTNQIELIIRRLDGLTNLDLPGFLTHAKTIKLQQESTVLLLITAPGTGKHAAEVLTGKVFEYMASGRPIVALAPHGPLRNIISQGFGYVAPPDDSSAIAATLERIYRTWLATKCLDYNPNQELLTSYSRREQARHLADLVKKVTL